MVYEQIDKNGAIDRYPKRIPKLDDSIPEDISADYAEALRCYDVNSYKASVVMCRRAIQSSTLEKGATKNRLFDQINEIHSNGTITDARAPGTGSC